MNSSVNDRLTNPYFTFAHANRLMFQIRTAEVGLGRKLMMHGNDEASFAVLQPATFTPTSILIKLRDFTCLLFNSATILCHKTGKARVHWYLWDPSMKNEGL